MNQFIIETDRLGLRYFCSEDLADLYEISIQTAVAIEAGWEPHKDINETKIVLDKYLGNKEVFGIVEKSSNKLVGRVALYDFHNRAGNHREIGFILNENFWGKGYMTEVLKAVVIHAFEEIKVDYLVLAHYDNNQRSKRVIEKCGFAFEGVIHNEIERFDGVLLNSHYYYLPKCQYERNLK